ncbi:MAG: glycosyl hydrolase [Terriglobia bacterium]
MLKSARAEHQRVVLSFTPVEGATSYLIQVRDSQGGEEVIDGVLVHDYSAQGLTNGVRYAFRVAAAGPRGTTNFSSEVSAVPAMEPDWASLAEAFQGDNPTRSSCPFWMVHGNETDEQLREFMRVIQRFGFEGVTLHPYDYKGFLKENNWKSWRVIVDAARKLGLTVWEQDDQNYPCGYAAGLIVARDRKLARWEVTLEHQAAVEGPQGFSLDIGHVVHPKRQLAAIVAAGPGNEFRDLTDSVSGGRLLWEAPAGRWRIFVHAAWQPGIEDPKGYPDLVRGQIRGYIDPLSEEATDLFVKLVLEATCRAIGMEHAGKSWKGFYIDEPAFHSSGAVLGKPGGFPYTPDLFSHFQAHYGYSLRLLLPLLWVELGPKTVTTRHDYMDFVSREYDRLFLGKQTAFAEAHGMQIDGHVVESSPFQLGAGTGSDFRMLESYSMGGFDNIFDQWYMPDEDVYWRQPKMASSISHYKETPLDEAMVEHFAATGWRTGLTEMKAMMDWTTCRGMSRTVPCGLDTQTPPVWEDQPEFWLYGENPLAPYFHSYQVVANRETMMIRGGRHIAQALILDTAASAWVGAAEELWKSDKAFSQAHVDYDNVSYEVFSDQAKCRIRGRRILLGHEEYKLVVLPGVDALPLAVAQRLLEFYEAGGTVITLGPGIRIVLAPEMTSGKILPRIPFRSADGRHDEEVRKIASKIWGPDASRRGRAFVTEYKDVSKLLYTLETHDVWIDPNLALVQYYHRQLSGRDLYFFNNEGEDASTTVRLRGAKDVPEFWDPVTGRISQAPCYSSDGSQLSLRLDLRRYESTFVVINPSAAPMAHFVSSNADEVLRKPDGKLILRKFEPGTFRYELDQLGGAHVRREVNTPPDNLAPINIAHGWSRRPIKPNGAIYRTAFAWSGGRSQSASLVIHHMTQVIQVRLNSVDCGMRFVYPFRFDLGGALRRGENHLELTHIERHTFSSQLGKIRLEPYYELSV